MPRAKEILPHAILRTHRDFISPGTDGAIRRGPYRCGVHFNRDFYYYS